MNGKAFLANSISRKNLMALTGLFLCIFLVVHLAGNLQLLLPAERAHAQFNWYSDLLSHNIFIKLIAYLLYASIIVHAIYALVLTIQNRRAGGPKGYEYDQRKVASNWYSRNMGILGTIILIFLVIHMKDFWYAYKFGTLPLDAQGNKDLYTIVVASFSQWWYVAIYVVALIALGYHLLHGFFSAFRTLGLYHSRYANWARAFGWIYTLLITGGFILIAIMVYLYK